MGWGKAENTWERLGVITEQTAQDKPFTALEKTTPQEEKFKRMQKEKVIHYYSLQLRIDMIILFFI